MQVIMSRTVTEKVGMIESVLSVAKESTTHALLTAKGLNVDPLIEGLTQDLVTANRLASADSRVADRLGRRRGLRAGVRLDIGSRRLVGPVTLGRGDRARDFLATRKIDLSRYHDQRGERNAATSQDAAPRATQKTPLVIGHRVLLQVLQELEKMLNW